MSCKSQPLASLLMLATLSACGGGGSEGSSTPPPEPAVLDTAQLVLEERAFVRATGLTLSEVDLKAALSVCNTTRGLYNLGPNEPAPAEYKGRTEVMTTRYVYSAGRAATYTEYPPVLELTDLQRWATDTAPPEARMAPDCSKLTLRFPKGGKIWADGIVWTLDYIKKEAVGRHDATAFTSRDSGYAATSTLAVPGIGACVLVTPKSGLPPTDGNLCYWDRFPLDRRMNLPWLLQSDNGTKLNMDIKNKAVSATSGAPLDAALFEPPAGFTRRMAD